ncbi:unnamed protein product [Malassezia sympodialis ATCC 42132]|uniref:uncharacterized protein n=1 Tax=Malassezia sympodialis (strain ATCC 42132) TaxID=1230383 RepID=UPI0002C2B158|nr:uncharacterized protein MSY001_0652 [Malassezia sympodialis ATCC 42132]CCU97946.1 unnamed protein product [Malassezia sympodialis ATCC 42132]|eukprot:XP_018739271.1 uncharacterized protein MSY001_0652 [Malassezia sympodialis ATCC 42132]
MKRIAERQIQREDGDDPHAVEDATTEAASTHMPREAAPRVIRGLPKRKGVAPSPSAPALSANPFAQLAPATSSSSLFGQVQLTPKSSSGSAPTAPKGPAPLPTSLSQPVLPVATKPTPTTHNELEYWKGVRGLNWSMIRHLVQVWNASDELADFHTTLLQFAAAYREHHEALASKWLGHTLETSSQALGSAPTESASLSSPKAAMSTAGPSKSAFSFGVKPVSSPSFSLSVGKPADAETGSAKPAFSIGSSNEKSAAETGKPAFKLSPAMELTGKPDSSSMDAPVKAASVSDESTKGTKPAFSFDTKEKTASEIGFSFGTAKDDSASKNTDGKPPFSFGTAKEPQGFSFGAAKDDAASKTAESKPAFSFGTAKKPQGFSFGTAKDDAASKNTDGKPAFSFGTAKEPQSFSFGTAKDDSAPKTTDDKPAFSSRTAKETQGFSFGAAKENKPVFSLSTANDDAASKTAKDKPAFSFGTATHDPASKTAEEKPAFSFSTTKEPQTFSFGTVKEEAASKTANDKPAFSFGTSSHALTLSSSTSKDQPTLSFGQSASSKVSDSGEKQTNETSVESQEIAPAVSSVPTTSEEPLTPANKASGTLDQPTPHGETPNDKAQNLGVPSTGKQDETFKTAESGPALKLPALPSGGFSFAGQAARSFFESSSQHTMDGVKAPALTVPPGGFAFGSNQVKLAGVSKDSQVPGDANTKAPKDDAPKDPITPPKPTATTKPITFGSATSPASHVPFGAAGSPPVAPHRFSFGSSPKEDNSPFTKTAIGPSFANTTGVAHGGSFQFGETPIAFAAPNPEPPKEDDNNP